MITVLTGSNNYLVNKELNKIVDDFKAENGDFAVEEIDGEEKSIEDINDSLGSLPFLSNRKLVILNSPSSNKQFSEKIDEMSKLIPDNTEVLIVEPKLDKRSKYHNFLKKSTNFKTFDELDTYSLSQWVISYVKEKGGSINKQSADYLIEMVGNSQLRIMNEIDKLVCYRSEVDNESIHLLVEPLPQTTIFQLLDATFDNEVDKLLQIYDEQRTQKVEPQQIIALLTWQLHVIAVIKLASGSNVEQIAKQNSLNPFVVRKSMRLANKMSLDELKEIIKDLLKLDVDLEKQDD